MNKVLFRLMSPFKGIVSITLCLFTLSAAMSKDLCDHGCKCVLETAQCQFTNFKNVTGFFPNVIVNIKISSFKLNDLGPIKFGNSTETISFHNGEVSTLTPLAFRGLRSVRLIEFLGANIQTIQSDAFSDIASHASINFIDCIIGIIGPEAFHHLRGLREIRFEHSLISVISSFAFRDIQAHSFNITDTEITNLQNFSLHSLYDLEVFEFNNLVVDIVSSSAFENLRNISRVKLTNCHFKTLPCLVLKGLREATPGNHDTFQFTKSQIDCDCSVAAFMEYIRAHPNSVADTVECSRGNALFNGSLKTLSTHELKSKCSNSTCVLEVEDASTSSMQGVGVDTARSVTNSHVLVAMLQGISMVSWYFCK
ncbi:unnamed protein product [Lymnaea stagnalis]|uniref:Uncharacterized protein n=1 Tax=Lymnaea stagnalis TaxID=6523 RepID=A0AAV2H984_LYMST